MSRDHDWMLPHVGAHKHSSNHREELVASEVCGCFYCLGTFSPDRIVDWVDGNTTALCPLCGIDSVLGSASGFAISDEFLGRMKAYWF